MHLRLFLLAALMLIGQSKTTHAQTIIPFDSPRWKMNAKTAIREEYQGAPCLKLAEGRAVLGDADFTNGIIEFDIALGKNRYFPGIGFRMQDDENGEIYYLRPHQSGNPDAMQYYPEYNGAGGWQIYYGKGYNNAHALPFDRWLHIRILVDDDRAEVYFDKENEPVLYMHALKRAVAPGRIQLFNGDQPVARYANFSITPMPHCPLKSPRENLPVLPASTIRTWQVSQAFDESAIDSIVKAAGNARQAAGSTPQSSNSGQPSSDSVGNGIQWQEFQTDERGIADLSKLSAVGKGHNTIICRLVIPATEHTVKKLHFGFSDRIKIYCNKKLLYAGSDVFLSRDYRFLGTVGFFDTVFPELEKGSNEIWMIVSEDYGGWGIEARLESL